MHPQYLAASYFYICVLIRIYIEQSHTTMYVSSTSRYLVASCCYICQWGRRVRFGGRDRARCFTGSSCSHRILACAAGRARCFTESSSSEPVLARDTEWAAVGGCEIGTARILLRILTAFNGYLMCSDRCVTVIRLCRLRGVTKALVTSVSGSGFRSGNRRQSGTGGPICVPCPLGSYKSLAG
jgi:hypothetical protein